MLVAHITNVVANDKISTNVMRIHANVISKHVVTQKFHFKLMKFTLFQFGVKSNLPKLFQNQMYMTLLVLHVVWENEDIFNVTNHEIIQVFTRNIVHKMLENNRRVSKDQMASQYIQNGHNGFWMLLSSIHCLFECAPSSMLHVD